MAWHLKLGNLPPQAYFDLEVEFSSVPYVLFGYGFSRFSPLSKKDRERLPTTAIQQNSFELEDDFVSVPKVDAVSQNFKDVVEALEPGVHEFFPITLKRKDGTPYERSYYIFNCCQRFEAMILGDMETRKFRFNEYNGFPSIFRPEPPYAMSLPKVDGRHFLGGGVF